MGGACHRTVLASAHRAGFVSINHPVPPDLGGSIRSDHVRGIAQAVDHLMQSGRRTLAYMSGPDHVYAAQERLRGFMQAIRNAGLPLDPTLIVPWPRWRKAIACGNGWVGEVGTDGWHEASDARPPACFDCCAIIRAWMASSATTT
jgi:hypothetical protein